MSEYVMYGKENCSFCSKAKQLLDSKQFSYDYKNVLEPGIRNELLTLYPEASTVPQIFHNGKHIGGFHELEIYIKTEQTKG